MSAKSYYRQKTLGAPAFNLSDSAEAATLTDEAGATVGLTGIPATAKARVQITGGTALFAGSGVDVTAANGFLLADGVIHEMDMPVTQMSFLQASGTAILRMLIR